MRKREGSSVVAQDSVGQSFGSVALQETRGNVFEAIYNEELARLRRLDEASFGLDLRMLRLETADFQALKEPHSLQQCAFLAFREGEKEHREGWRQKVIQLSPGSFASTDAKYEELGEFASTSFMSRVGLSFENIFAFPESDDYLRLLRYMLPRLTDGQIKDVEVTMVNRSSFFKHVFDYSAKKRLLTLRLNSGLYKNRQRKDGHSHLCDDSAKAYSSDSIDNWYPTKIPDWVTYGSGDSRNWGRAGKITPEFLKMNNFGLFKALFPNQQFQEIVAELSANRKSPLHELSPEELWMAIARPSPLRPEEQLESGIEWGRHQHISGALGVCAMRDIKAGRLAGVPGLYPESVPRNLKPNSLSQYIHRLGQALKRAVTFGKPSPTAQQVEYLHQTLQELDKLRSFAQAHLNHTEQRDTGLQLLARYRTIIRLIISILPKLEFALEMQTQEPVRLHYTGQLLLSTAFDEDQITKEHVALLERQGEDLEQMVQVITEMSESVTKK